MTEYQGVSGTYSDFKLVKTRGVVQVIVEFPIEEAQQVLDSLGGLPMPGKEEHVSLGLRSKLLEIAERQIQPEERHANLSLVGKQRYAGADEAQKAVMRAGRLPEDEGFWAWARDRYQDSCVFDKLSAVAFIRDMIGGSRSLIDDDPEVYRKFIAMETEYLVDTGKMAVPR